MTIEQFWAKVSKTDSCWLWTGWHDRQGYGRLRTPWSMRPPYNIGAHRMSWELHHGKIREGLYVLHRCDNPACVNPAHLFLGTARENTQDALAKGRMRANTRPLRGSASKTSKLTEQDVVAIRASSLSGRALARQYGVNPKTILGILKRHTWKHVR